MLCQWCTMYKSQICKWCKGPLCTLETVLTYISRFYPRRVWVRASWYSICKLDFANCTLAEYFYTCQWPRGSHLRQPVLLWHKRAYMLSDCTTAPGALFYDLKEHIAACWRISVLGTLLPWSIALNLAECSIVEHAQNCDMYSQCWQLSVRCTDLWPGTHSHSVNRSEIFTNVACTRWPLHISVHSHACHAEPVTGVNVLFVDVLLSKYMRFLLLKFVFNASYMFSIRYFKIRNEFQ